GAVDIAPFSALWQRIDATWLEAVKYSNPLAFVSSATLLDWMPIVFDALILFLFMRMTTSETLRRLAKAILIAVPLATLTWWIGADLLRDVLLTQIQLGRIFWPMHLLAAMALPVVVVSWWRRDAVGRWAASAVCLAGLAVSSNWPTGWLCLVWAVLSLAATRSPKPLSPSIARLAVIASGMAMFAVSAKVLRDTVSAVMLSPQRFDDIGLAPIVLSLPFVAAALAGGLLVLAHRRALLAPAALLTTALVAYGCTMWDERSSWQRILEAGPPGGVRLFDDVLPAGASTYWQGEEILASWLLAQRADFYAYTQGGGLLFSRATSMEFMRRRQIMFLLEFQQGLCSEINMMVNGGGASNSCDVSSEVVDMACANPGHPDYLVLTSSLPARAPLAQWHPPAVVTARGAPSFYLYRCAVAQDPGTPARTTKP
ncbi:MAG TPA: hypothetical protein VH328_13340, partial [Burkholderiaceae bacterium]|nr:hypothetical protein [Burkholderiaceae bacterium]